MDSFGIKDQPTLVEMANVHPLATFRLVNFLQREVIHSNTVGTLHYLSWECNLTSYVYKIIQAHHFLKQLKEYDQPFDADILTGRLKAAFVPFYRFSIHKIRAHVLFKHIVEHKIQLYDMGTGDIKN